MKQQLISFWLDYVNNYLTIDKMSEDYDLTKDECIQLIEMGKKYHEQRVEELKK